MARTVKPTIKILSFISIETNFSAKYELVDDFGLARFMRCNSRIKRDRPYLIIN
jgi:hypothetical protein